MTEPLKLRVGGVYLDRMNKCVKIVQDIGPDYDYRFVSSMGHRYTQKGRRWGSINLGQHQYDLVSEVTEAPEVSAAPADDGLRTRAALVAMTGILASGNLGSWSEKVVADAALRHADALIAALKEAHDGTQ